MSLKKTARVLQKRIPFYLAGKVVLSLFLLVYAANITVNVSQYQAENGGRISFTNNLIATDTGISRASSGSSAAGASCASNVTFTGTPQTANTAITANDYIFTIQVNTTASTAVSTCFTVTLTLTSNSTNTYTLKLATGSSVTANQTISCKFDIGATLPSSPYSFTVAVQ